MQRTPIDPRALSTEVIDTPRHWRVSEWLTETSPGGGSAKTELYWVDFEVDDQGVMRASVRTVSPDRAYRSGKLRFGESFRAALQRFEAAGVEVNTFEGDWSYMTPDEISDNLRVFREGMAAGKTREEAARGTPTGKVATRAGFEVTSVENVPESQEHLVEQGVSRWRVKAIFRRQSPPLQTGPAGGGGGTTTTENLTVRQGESVTSAEEMPKRLTGPGVEPAVPQGLSIKTGVLKLGAAAGEAILVSLIADYLNAKIKAHFDKKTFEARMKALRPTIDASKDKALAEATAKKLPVLQSKHQLYWIIELRIVVRTTVVIAGAGSRVITGAPDPELLSVRISESDTGSEGPAQSATPNVAPAHHAVILLEDSQVITYSEPMPNWHYDWGFDLKSLPKFPGPTPLKAEEDVLRFSQTGQEVTLDRLVAWANRNFPRLDDPRILKNIYASHEFKGSNDARERAAIAFTLKLREEKAQGTVAKGLSQ